MGHNTKRPADGGGGQGGTLNLTLCAISFFLLSAAGSYAVKLIPFIVLFAALLAISIIVRRKREAFSETATPSASGRDDKRYWIAGLIYANPNDPALLVKKRFGLGRTLNFGHWASWLIMAVILAVPFVVQILAGHAGRH